MRLLLVEVRRLFARRFFWIGAVALLIGLGVSLGITAAQSEIPDAADRARAERVAAEQARQAETDRLACEEVERARRAGETPPSPDAERFTPGTDCTLFTAAPADAFLVDDPFRFTQEMDDRTNVLTVVLALFAFLVGATAVGAEWHHGTLAALLLWEPRRLRVFLAKLVGLLTGVTFLGVTAYVASVAGHWAVARLRGVVGVLNVTFQRDLALATARGLALALVAAAAGYALALMLRRTAAALGVLIAYLGIVELGARAFFGQAWDPYMLSTQTAAWMLGKVTVYNYDCSIGGDCDPVVTTLTLQNAAIYLGAVAGTLLIAAAVSFRRREVA
jgi:ABC-2 type transport system permease protein